MRPVANSSTHKCATVLCKPIQQCRDPHLTRACRARLSQAGTGHQCPCVLLQLAYPLCRSFFSSGWILQESAGLDGGGFSLDLDHDDKSDTNRDRYARARPTPPCCSAEKLLRWARQPKICGAIPCLKGRENSIGFVLEGLFSTTKFSVALLVFPWSSFMGGFFFLAPLDRPFAAHL